MTETVQWRLVESLFHAALELPASQREAFLRRRCGADRALYEAVDSLLPHDGDGPAQTRETIQRVARRALASNLPATGERLGAYRVLRQIGQGGMGAVYLAERDDHQFHRQVAIKIIQTANGLGDATAQRFRRERQILADLQHPNIARLLDGGSTEAGTPYLVMEYVEGEDILSYCQHHALGLRDRLALLKKVCDAVTYAHRRLVVHCDLKPSNILVDTAGEPRLLDFGIARLLDRAGAGAGERTGIAGERLLTPHYASPEQRRGEPASTQADVYALGVVLYELLTGHLPIPVAEPLAAGTAEPAPAAPSLSTNDTRLRRQLQGDLDAIALKTLCDDPAGRYLSLEDLARDLESHLAQRPVTARPARWRYIAGRFVSRNRAASLAMLLLALSMAGFGLALMEQARDLRRERDLAQQQLARANAFSGYLENLFSGLDPNVSGGEDITVRQMLEKAGAGTGDTKLQGAARQPDVAAAIHRVLGGAYSGLGLLPEAQRELELARELHRSGQASDPQEALRTLLALGQLYNQQFRVDERLAIAREAVALARTLYPQDHPLNLQALSTLASARHMKGDLEGAARDFESLYQRSREHFGPDHEQTIGAIGRLAVIEHWLGQFSAAEQYYRQCLADARRVLGERHTLALTCLCDLGSLLEGSGRYAEAVPVISRHLRLATEVLGPEHPDTLRSLHNLADSYRGLGRYNESEALFLETLAARRQVLGPDHIETLQTQIKLARLYYLMHREPEAIALARQTLETQRASLGERHPTTLITTQILADAYLGAGRTEEAGGLLAFILPARIEALGEQHPDLVTTYRSLARLERQRSNPAGAQSWEDRAARIRAGAAPAP